MKYGVDMLLPPSRTQAQTMRRAGYSWCGVYVGGPRAAARHVWQQVDGVAYPVRDLEDIFDGFLPIYVGCNQPWDVGSAYTADRGAQDGDDANRCTGACGFDSWTPLILDLEYGTFQQNPVGVEEYVRAWAEVVRGAGHVAGIYSDIESLNAMYEWDFVDIRWGAAWVRGNFATAPWGRFDPSDPPPWDAWQFGGATIAGVQVDCNSASDAFKFATYG